MSSGRVGKKSKKIASKPNAVSLQEKIKMVDKEEQALLKDIDDLKKWTDTIDAMKDDVLKEYLQNRPEELKSVKIQKNKTNQKVRAERLCLITFHGVSIFNSSNSFLLKRLNATLV
ncbi:uncharacterized protein LOC111276739 [Durio zibethinus]|uniref:Uncharacterized protein LOC111276739 n=1 Tax=Durio zibethinus TaxID=66656 RepID=A0A6P5WQE8_DURZI|nr:uncharacterized protein LOC111276739 [Durio zibethinus]